MPMSTPSFGLLERWQVPFYFAAVGVGAAVGLAAPAVGSELEHALYPALALLLYTMFLHVPLVRLRQALRERSFLAAALVTNFVVLPPLVFGLTRLLPGDATLVVAVLLVLLVPCTDWSIVFAGLGGGSAPRMVAATPFLLAAQFLMLPLYLWLFTSGEAAQSVAAGPFLEAFAVVIALPLLVAAITERAALRSARVASGSDVLRLAPVPMTALVLFFVVASQVEVARSAGGDLLAVVPIFAIFPFVAVAAAWAVTRLWRLHVAQARTVAFSASTRNSFVVLPLALALPEGADLAAAVIVTQAMVELTAMVGFIRLVPRWVMRAPSSEIIE
jgi:arsenite transporter